MLEVSPYIGGVWIIAGALLVLAESLFVGVGFLFAGFGALLTGLAIHLGLLAPEQFALQLATFFLATGGTAALLWKKLKAFRQGKGNYHNMVGDRAIVESDRLDAKTIGKVRWSGTLLDARLAQGQAPVARGQEVIIQSIEGNTALCQAITE